MVGRAEDASLCRFVRREIIMRCEKDGCRIRASKGSRIHTWLCQECAGGSSYRKALVKIVLTTQDLSVKMYEPDRHKRVLKGTKGTRSEIVKLTSWLPIFLPSSFSVLKCPMIRSRDGFSDYLALTTSHEVHRHDQIQDLLQEVNPPLKSELLPNTLPDQEYLV